MSSVASVWPGLCAGGVGVQRCGRGRGTCGALCVAERMSAAVSHFITREGTGALQLLGLAAQLAASRRAARSAQRVQRAISQASQVAPSWTTSTQDADRQTADRRTAGKGRREGRYEARGPGQDPDLESDTGDTMGRAIEFRRRRLQSCTGSGQQGEQASRASRPAGRAGSSGEHGLPDEPFQA